MQMAQYHEFPLQHRRGERTEPRLSLNSKSQLLRTKVILWNMTGT